MLFVIKYCATFMNSFIGDSKCTMQIVYSAIGLHSVLNFKLERLLVSCIESSVLCYCGSLSYS